MKTLKCDVLIIGGGVAGITAACTLWNIMKNMPQNPDNAREISIILAERESSPGGILRQCMHEGFGEENHTGPAYAGQILRELEKTTVQVLCDTDVRNLQEEGAYLTAETNGTHGPIFVCSRHVILAAGCYERSCGNLMISGTRPEGIFTAGELQRMINLEGYSVLGENRGSMVKRRGREAVVIGSGDIGLIIARRLILNGCSVKRVLEIQEKCPALERNKESCLKKYQLPLQLNTRVIAIHGDPFLTGVTVENRKTKETEVISCDILVTAAGLIPDQSLAEHLSDRNRITLAGNCERIYPSVEGIVHSVAGKCRKISEKLVNEIQGNGK